MRNRKWRLSLDQKLSIGFGSFFLALFGFIGYVIYTDVLDREEWEGPASCYLLTDQKLEGKREEVWEKRYHMYKIVYGRKQVWRAEVFPHGFTGTRETGYEAMNKWGLKECK